MRDDRDKCADWVDSYEILSHWGVTAAWQAEAVRAIEEWLG